MTMSLNGDAPVEIPEPIALMDGRQACPECGKVFKAGGIERHRSVQHGVGSGDMVHCPQIDCESVLKPVSVQKHLRKVHGITRSQGAIDRQLAVLAGATVGAQPMYPKKRGRPPGSKNGTGTRKRPSQAKGLPKGFLAEPLHEGDLLTVDDVLNAKATHTLTAAEIVRMTAEILWPNGVLHNHVEALLAWHTQTEQFLASVGE